MFYDIFAGLCVTVQKKPSAVAEELGINKSNVSNWKKSGYTPRGDALQSIAEYFGVSVDYLLGNDIKEGDGQAKSASDDDIQFALFGGKVTDEAYEEVKAFAQFVKEKYKKKG